MVDGGGTIQKVGPEFEGMAHMGIKVWGCGAPPSGAHAEGGEAVVGEFASTSSVLEGCLRFCFVEDAGVVVGIFKVPPTDMAMAGTVPVPVAATMAGSACSNNHRTVSPSDLWPSSRVNWKIRAAHVAGMRILRPRPSTFVWRSFVDGLLTAAAVCTGICIATGTIIATAAGLSSTSFSSFNTATGVCFQCSSAVRVTESVSPPPLFLLSAVHLLSCSSRSGFINEVIF